MKCPNCGADVPTGELFCSECGTNVVPEERPTPQSAVPSSAGKPRQGLPRGLLIGLGGLLALAVIAGCVFGVVTLLRGREPTPTWVAQRLAETPAPAPTATPTPVPVATTTPAPTPTPTMVPVSSLMSTPKLIPADTVFFALVNPDIQDLADAALLDDMEDEAGISFKDDVKPWLGSELAIAVTGMEGLLEGTTAELGIIIAAVTKNTEASDAFLEKMLKYLKDEDYEFGKETYRDVTYYVEEEAPLAFGTISEFVVATMGQDTMKDVIDAAQGKTDSLADNEPYAKLLGALPGDAGAYAFLDIMHVIDTILKGGEAELPEETLEQLTALGPLGVAISPEQEGILVHIVLGYDPDALPSEALENMAAKATANRILKRIPYDALGFISSQNLAADWKSLLAIMNQNPDFEVQIKDLEDALGLKIDEELLDWLTGEFAIALVKPRGMEGVSPGSFAVFEIENQQEAKDTLGSIVRALEESAYVEFQEKVIGNVEMRVLVDPYTGEITLGYGFTDRHLIIGFSEDALEQAVDDDIRSIAGDETFKKVQKHLPGEVGGYLYTNVEAVWRLTYENMSAREKEDLDESIRSVVEPIKAIGTAAVPTDPKKGIIQRIIFVYVSGE